ncbi:MAG: hypothetical protein JXA20_20570 [Spirochaetes bacterium]|nr:hypothetical protein [Spirochaetota bacterium]
MAPSADDFILEGITTTRSPSASNILMELSYLRTGRIDFVQLKNGLDLMQAAIHPARRDCFLVEAIVWSDTGGTLYRQREPLPMSRARGAFSRYLRQGTLPEEEGWDPAEWNAAAVDSGRGRRIALTAVAAVLVAGATAAALASGRPWYEGSAIGSLAACYIAALVRIVGGYLDRAQRQVILKSIEMGMPCEIWRGRSLIVLDKKTRSMKKLARLELMLLGRIFAGLVLALALLLAVVSIGRLLLSCAAPWE